MNIEKRYERLLSRRAPSEDRLYYRFDEAFEKEPGVFTKYILGALSPVDRRYTERLKEQGDRIQNQLSKGLEAEYPNLEFRRQGSVSNSTHIRYSSDVDVLVITDKFVTLEHPQQPTSRYEGDPADNLLNLRACCRQHLSSAFPAATVDNSGSTAIAIEGGSLACKVDVVPSNWFDSNDYKNYRSEIFRGVQVIDKATRTRTKNFPFKFNYRIDEKDKKLNGTMRMLIRLLKTIKADSEETGSQIDFSSFDICSVIYQYPERLLVKNLKLPLDIIKNLLFWMEIIIGDQEIRNQLLVVDDSRKIFDQLNKLGEFKKLYADLKTVYDGATQENRFGIITEAHLR